MFRPTTLCLTATLALATLSITGCMVGPKYHQPIPPVPTKFKEGGTPDSGTPDIAYSDWWRVFKDPELARLEAETDTANQDIKLAVARVEQAEAGAKYARSFLFPTISIGAAASRTREAQNRPNNRINGNSNGKPATYNDFQFPAFLSYEVDAWGRVRSSLDAAKATEQASAADLRFVRFARFPNARAFATASSVAGMQKQIDPDFIKSFWEPRFPGQVPSQLTAPEILEGDTLYLEGEELQIIALGHTDTANSTALYVPSIGLVVSGDAVYNNTHPYLAECDEKARNEWLRALEKIEALHPKAVIAGHGVLDPDSSPDHIEETRGYIRDFNQVAASTSTAMDLYEKMLALHPNRVNPGSLWATAKALRGNAHTSEAKR